MQSAGRSTSGRTSYRNGRACVLALRHGIKQFGIPKCIYVDNGREFLNRDMGGLGHRRKANDTQPDPPPIFKRLGIEMRNAIVRNARAKPVERTFRTVKEQFSKLFSGFCGGTILEKPESLKSRIKKGQLPRDFEIRQVLDAWIDGEYNCQLYGGSERCFKNMSRIEVWNSTITAVRMASESDLNLMLMPWPRRIRSCMRSSGSSSKRNRRRCSNECLCITGTLRPGAGGVQKAPEYGI